ncbi:hypothetical protein [uncultured Tateyamaria sp.]|nr:hypothetical protein [uncultured Tateyamaria sp.]
MKRHPVCGGGRIGGFPRPPGGDDIQLLLEMRALLGDDRGIIHPIF